MLVSSVGGAVRSRRVLVLVCLSGMAAALAGCNSVGESAGGSGNVVTNAIFGSPGAAQNNAIVVDATNFGTQMEDCPSVSIRPGTEVMIAYEAGKKVNEELGEKPAIRYQSSIVKTARECRKTPTGVAVKVGVMGRTVAGPAGKAGTVTLPIRVVVMEGLDKVIKSELYKIPVNLQEPDMAADFTKIDDTIEVPITPDNNNFRIYVGFDESGTGKGRS